MDFYTGVFPESQTIVVMLEIVYLSLMAVRDCPPCLIRPEMTFTKISKNCIQISSSRTQTCHHRIAIFSNTLIFRAVHLPHLNTCLRHKRFVTYEIEKD